MKFIKATCPGCGASLELADHLQSANCPNCGSKVLIDWETKQNPAAYLELAKRFIQSGNYKEADAQLTRVLEINPDNREAWLWKWVALTLGAKSDNERRKAREVSPGYLLNIKLSNEEIGEILNRMLDGRELMALAEWARSGTQLSAELGRNSMLTLRNPISRKEILEKLAYQIAVATDIAFTLRNVSEPKGKLKIQFHDWFLFDALEPEQPDDWIQIGVHETDWRGKVIDKTKSVREKPSHWRKWLKDMGA